MELAAKNITNTMEAATVNWAGDIGEWTPGSLWEV